jgi:hypothetical protein
MLLMNVPIHSCYFFSTLLNGISIYKTWKEFRTKRRQLSAQGYPKPPRVKFCLRVKRLLKLERILPLFLFGWLAFKKKTERIFNSKAIRGLVFLFYRFFTPVS